MAHVAPGAGAPNPPSTADDRPSVATLCGVALVAASALVLQIALTKYFSFRLWYHYAFLIISITMLGLGASGSMLGAVHRRLESLPRHRILFAAAFLGGVAGLVALVGLTVQTRLGVAEITDASVGGVATLALYFVGLSLPFFFSGCAISWALIAHGEHAPTVYAADLVGAAGGCLIAVATLSQLYAEQAIAMSSAVAFAGAALFASRRAHRMLGGAGVVASLGVALFGASLFGTAITRTKGLHNDLRVGRLIASRAGMNGRVDAVAGALRNFAWGLHRPRAMELPEQIAIRIDGDALTAVTRWDGDFASWAFVEHVPSSLPFAMAAPKRALVIGPGGGMDLVNAVGHGVTRVTGVEINGKVIELMRGPLHDFSGGIYSDPRVEVVHADARGYVERSRERFDLIQLTLVDTFAAIASGALALSEDFLYTREAFAAYVAHLSDRGLLAIGRTRDEAPGLVSLIAAATEERGLDLARHIFIARNPGSVHGLIFLFQNAPFSDEQIAAGVRFVRRGGFELVYAPGLERSSDPFVAAMITARDRDRFLRDAPLDLEPETDDAPFYFRASKWSDILGTYTGGRGNLLVVLAAALVFGLGAIVVPLLLSARTALRRRWPVITLFAAIGLGYIMVEMVILTKLALFLGHPTRSITVTLFALLVSSGLGSAYSRRLLARCERTGARWIRYLPFVAVLAIGGFYTWGLGDVTTAVLGLELPARVAIAAVLVGAIGFPMGMPLPIGLAALHGAPRELGFWAWGLNGVSSVVGSIAAILLAQLFGYSYTLSLAMGCYLIAVLCLAAAEEPVVAGVQG